MIYYLKTDDTVYVDLITRTLRAYNEQFTGPVTYEEVFFYALDQGILVGALKLSSIWDWATVSKVFYEQQEVLDALVKSAWDYYKHKVFGIKFITGVKSRYEAFLNSGFKPNTILSDFSGKPYYYADLTDRSKMVNHDFEIIFNQEAIKPYQDILDEHVKNFNEEHGINDSSEFLQIVALDDETFVGGLQGYLYEDYLHISRIAVLENYRHHAIGKNLMLQAIIEAENKGLKGLELGTCDFQARGFYEKLGFKVVHTRKNNPKGYNSYTLILKFKEED